MSIKREIEEIERQTRIIREVRHQIEGLCIHGRIPYWRFPCPECRRAEMGEAGWPDDLPFQDADDAIMDAEDV